MSLHPIFEPPGGSKKTDRDHYSRRPENLKKEAHRCYLIATISMNLFSIKLSQYFVMCRLVTHKVTTIVVPHEYMEYLYQCLLLTLSL